MFDKKVIEAVLLGVGFVASMGFTIYAYGKYKYYSGRIDQSKEFLAKLEQIRKEIDEECNSLEES